MVKTTIGHACKLELNSCIHSYLITIAELVTFLCIQMINQIHPPMTTIAVIHHCYTATKPLEFAIVNESIVFVFC